MTTDATEAPAEATRSAGEWSGICWTDSSWELRRGLEVVEDLPPALWPREWVAAGEAQRRNVPSSPM